MNKLLLFYVLALSGCAGDPVYTPVRVEVPVEVKCHTQAVNQPVFETSHVTVNNTIYEKMKAALIEIKQRIKYENNLTASIKACQ